MQTGRSSLRMYPPGSLPAFGTLPGWLRVCNSVELSVPHHPEPASLGGFPPSILAARGSGRFVRAPLAERKLRVPPKGTQINDRHCLAVAAKRLVKPLMAGLRRPLDGGRTVPAGSTSSPTQPRREPVGVPQ